MHWTLTARGGKIMKYRFDFRRGWPLLLFTLLWGFYVVYTQPWWGILTDLLIYSTAFWIGMKLKSIY